MSLGNELRRRKALIRLGYSCNNSCIFCHSSVPRFAGTHEPGTDECKRRIAAAAAAGAEMAVFSGGEPTIRKDLLELCGYAGSLGLESGIITNGRMLSYRDFAEKLFGAGVRYILISLHGDDAKTHNFLTGCESFAQAVAGIRNAAALDAQLVVNTVITRANADRLAGISRLLAGFAPLRHKFSLPEPKGAALDNFDLILSPGEAADAAARFLVSRGELSGVEVGFDGFTPCLLDDFFSLNDDFLTHGFCLVSYPDDETFFSPDHGDRAYADDCPRCSVRHVCPGVYSEYFAKFPALALKPLSRPVSNSLRFDLRDSHPCDGPDAACGAACAAGPAPARCIGVRKGKKFFLYETREAETDAAELLRIKCELEQVYHYESGDTGKSDSTERLKKLDAAAMCRECAKRMLCAGVYEYSRKKPYAGALAEMLAVAKTLSGRVLEVGCGDGPFFGFFRERVRDGAISYYAGIDPELANEETSEHGRFVLKRSRLEDFISRDGRFDCAVLFRSYQHLQDLDRALAALHGAIAPGGAVVIIEDYKHIELHDETDAGGAGGARFHHYRNQSARDAAECLEMRGFRIDEIRPVTRATAPVWTIFAARRD